MPKLGISRYFYRMKFPAIDLLPQRPPFQFIDTITHVTEDEIQSSFLISKQSLFLLDDTLSESALIENMAQTIAAGNSLHQQSTTKTPQIGFIGAIKKIKIQRSPAVHDLLETTVKTLHVIGDARIAEAKIFCNQIEIASAELTIFVQNKL